jgi:alkaline phosphatase
MKRNFRYFSMVLAIILMVSSVSVSYGKKAKNEPQVKYVFYLIGDGMGINAVSGTEIYNRYTGNGPEQVNFLHFPVRTQVNTNSASTLVTGSAAAGTSLATGRKTYTGAIGVDTERNPISSIAEWAKASGAGVGIATSVAVNHATPAAFYAHVSNRDSYDAITRQFIHSDVVDFAAGAGFLTERNLGLDATFYEQEARGEGVKVFYGAESFGNVKTEYDRVLCLGGKDLKELPFAIDRKEGDTALKDFVTTGIDYLYGRYAEEGFFFMIEGGKIDYAGHNDDAASCFREINDFAEALDVVLAFCDRHPGETLIVVTADHETGGVTLGRGKGYAYDLSVVKQAEKATEGTDVSNYMNDISKDSLSVVAKIGWTTTSHTGGAVPVFAVGAGSGMFAGRQDNTDIPKKICKAMGIEF